MKEFFTTLICAIFATFIFVLCYGTIVMWLWNWIMPFLFGLPTITWLQGLGIYFLAHILFATNTTINNNSKN